MRTSCAVVSVCALALSYGTTARADEVDTPGTVSLNVDSNRGEAGAGTFVTTSNPVISETDGAGEWEVGSTITLTAPDGFEFNPAQDVTVRLGAGNYKEKRG